MLCAHISPASQQPEASSPGYKAGEFTRRSLTWRCVVLLLRASALFPPCSSTPPPHRERKRAAGFEKEDTAQSPRLTEAERNGSPTRPADRGLRRKCRGMPLGATSIDGERLSDHRFDSLPQRCSRPYMTATYAHHGKGLPSFVPSITWRPPAPEATLPLTSQVWF